MASITSICNENIYFQLRWCKDFSEGKNSKIDVNQIKIWNHQKDGFLDVSYNELSKMHIEQMKIGQIVISKELPSERYNGIYNMHYIILNHNATTDEIDMALVRHMRKIELFVRIGIRIRIQCSSYFQRYLYGNVSYVIKMYLKWLQKISQSKLNKILCAYGK